jgi:dihydropteroate synthase
MQRWQLSRANLTIASRPLVMGIVNATPDSFFDGGLYLDRDKAIAHGLQLVASGADLLDIGGESTRPGSEPVPAEEELRRVARVVKELAGQTKVPISIDTSKAVVARRCLEAGAQIVNDVTALRGDPEMAAVVRDTGAGVVVMHMQGTPATMQDDPRYDDVVADIAKFFRARLKACTKAGIQLEQVVLDPGIGFGKTLEQTLTLLGRLEELQRLRRPVLLGVSRKGFLGQVTGKPRDQRLTASVAALCYAAARGAAQVVRVHDVAETRDAMALCGAIAEHRRAPARQEGGG